MYACMHLLWTIQEDVNIMFCEVGFVKQVRPSLPTAGLTKQSEYSAVVIFAVPFDLHLEWTLPSLNPFHVLGMEIFFSFVNV